MDLSPIEHAYTGTQEQILQLNDALLVLVVFCFVKERDFSFINESKLQFPKTEGWFLSMLETENYDRLIKMAMTLWAIWFFRNKRVWENKVVTPRFVVDWGMRQLQEWKLAASQVQGIQKQSTTASSRENSKWMKPTVGNLKINVDAAITQGASFFSVGMLLRDNDGAFLEGKTMKFSRVVSVMEAETTAIEEALLWIESKGITNVCVESDSLLAVQAINGNRRYQQEVGHSIDFCRLFLVARRDIGICHVRRLANRAAHNMARIPCELNSSVSVWSPPRFVLDSVMYDAT